MTDNNVMKFDYQQDKYVPVSRDELLEAKKNGNYVIEWVDHSTFNKLFLLSCRESDVIKILHAGMIHDIEEFL